MLVLPNNKSQTQQLNMWQREFRYLLANSYIQGACFIFFLKQGVAPKLDIVTMREMGFVRFSLSHVL